MSNISVGTLTATAGVALPSFTNSNRPSSSSIGTLVWNTEEETVQVWTGTNWLDVGKQINDGTSEAKAVESASYLYSNGIVTSGKSYRYITTPNGGVKRIWCDFDTKDKDGNSGWMLVSSFEVDYQWTFGALTTDGEIPPATSGRKISSNFGDFPARYFRCTIAPDASSSLGSSAPADWYFYNGDTNAPLWKEWWAFGSGVSDLYSGNNYTPNMLGDSGTAHDRQMLRPFTHAYNIKFAYQAAQTHMSLSDCTIDSQSPVPATGTSSPGVIDDSSLYWTALTTPNYFFSLYYQKYSNGSITNDGSIGILPQGSFSSTSAAGQDLLHANARTGYDDNTYGTYIGTSATSDMNTANFNNQTSAGALFWWIK